MAALVCIGSGPLAAQHASPWLPRDHWAGGALLRLHALGLTPPGFDPAARDRTTDEITAALRHAWLTSVARAAALGLPGLRTAPESSGAGLPADRTLRLVDSYLRRFAAERPAAFARAFGLARGPGYVQPILAAGFEARAGELRAGRFSPAQQWIEPSPIDDVATAAAAADVGAVWRDRLAATAQVSATDRDVAIHHLTIDADAGVLAVWIGRRSPGYSPQRAGGLVLHGAVAIEGAGLRLDRPVTLPVLGYTSGEVFAGRLDANGLVREPWLWGIRLHVQPHVRFDAGATRAAAFGSLTSRRLGLRQLLEVFVGANLSDDFADDQVFSIDARWRPPLAALPLELYGEWGVHDIAPDVFWQMPGLGLGARIAALPFAPAVELAFEHTQINRSCCNNPPWYHHFELADNWTENGVLLGHPLGGHGREWRIAATVTAFDARVLIEADAFRRTRGDENLFAQARAGRATGGTARLDAQLHPRVRVVLGGTTERGTSWSAHNLVALVWVRL